MPSSTRTGAEVWVGPVADPFLVPITALRHTPGARRLEHRVGRLGELTVTASAVPADAEVSVDVVLGMVVGGIEASGEVRAPWRGECRRCLRPVTGELQVKVRELYRPRSVHEAGEDEETYPLSRELLDLRPLARDALLLELPLAPLCQPDCAGLCPICGSDRNEAPCQCQTGATDPRWATLDRLRGAEGR